MKKHITKLLPLIRIFHSGRTDLFKKKYSTEMEDLDHLLVNRANNNKLAVVIHLYYADNWNLFNSKMKILSGFSFDIFITIPEHLVGFKKTILIDFPDAYIIEVPNQGRDVLPFITLASLLKVAGYETVLKFHSKKSTHRSDGQDWLESMLNQIIPEDKKALISIIEATKNPNFGVLGPADVYYPLTINFPANGIHLTKIIKDCFNRKVARESLQLNRKRYGFFGGTMFWVNLSSIEPLLKYKQSNFEKEAGQIDGTFAHAIERAFCLVPELSGKDIYQSDGKNITKRSYESDNIPDWSEDHDK